MFSEDDLLPISALQHLSFCERQWGLIHLEGIWGENRLTMEGRHLHERADENETEVRGDIRIARGLRLRSMRLGLSGKADVVEFHRIAPVTADEIYGMRLEGVAGLWRPVPVEYKRGKPKIEPCDEIQVCAQALCIEEMTGARVPQGMLFYGMPRRRYDVFFDINLREKTESLCGRLHALTESGETPSAKYEKKCDSCSLMDYCMPKIIGRRGKVEKYLLAAVSDAADEEGVE
jgi:CRISPR-associated exonuclease Cas4